ncbi:cytochrome b/b6 domain-containing protein [Kordiimonas sp. SCSIO 12603]|uniref:cytochrome b/b6 domain-containing protein n=1 Tax=Kordiimonas sp. SCSIO 12603 TaxID=2829596 RepID=UPI0021039B8A|nr:cytochrome b/b6 domain-containing protein [Kordiimonas sp. SCSIO 12603]UTW58882.1 cytochrome b/b6 domain-containing protein [Kordiimonas sp. SCSIO 12603]
MNKIKLWDGAVRVFHWSLALLFGLSLYSAFQDKFGIYADMHYYSGVAIIGLVLWRILWGFVGSDTARFAFFLKGPSGVRSYLKGDNSHIGHNPLGGWSVILMLLALFVQAVLGLFSSDGMLFGGPFSVYANDSNAITNIHEYLGYGLMGLIGLHILAVLFYELIKKQKLIMPMLTGWAKVVNRDLSLKGGSIMLAITMAVAVALLLYWYIPAYQ